MMPISVWTLGVNATIDEPLNNGRPGRTSILSDIALVIINREENPVLIKHTKMPDYNLTDRTHFV